LRDREKLAADLPGILPELNGDAMWERILSDPRPRSALTTLGDEIAAQFEANPSRFAPMSEVSSPPRQNTPAQKQSA
jgi:hypothetical protein